MVFNDTTIINFFNLARLASITWQQELQTSKPVFFNRVPRNLRFLRVAARESAERQRICLG